MGQSHLGCSELPRIEPSHVLSVDSFEPLFNLWQGRLYRLVVVRSGDVELERSRQSAPKVLVACPRLCASIARMSSEHLSKAIENGSGGHGGDVVLEQAAQLGSR